MTCRIGETRVDYSGVLRCCLESVAREYLGPDIDVDRPVSLGAKSQCRNCGQPFTLVDGNPPVWKPNWKLGQL